MVWLGSKTLLERLRSIQRSSGVLGDEQVPADAALDPTAEMAGQADPSGRYKLHDATMYAAVHHMPTRHVTPQRPSLHPVHANGGDGVCGPSHTYASSRAVTAWLAKAQDVKPPRAV